MEDVRRWLLRAMDEAFDERAWHGPNLLGSIRGLSAADAAWRPAPGRHSVWELVLHCAYWKHRVHGRVAAGSLERFPRPGRNFPRPSESGAERDWRADVELLKDIHGRLRDVAASLPAAELDRPGPRQKRTRLQNLMGIAHHDVYHAGQIRLVRLLGEDAGWA